MKTEKTDSQILDVLLSLYHGRGNVSRAARADLAGRKMVCTPFEGAYGRAGWVLCVNGSPPRGTVLLTVASDHPERIVYFDGVRSKTIPEATPTSRAFWGFWRSHLKQTDGPFDFYLTEVGGE